jgi:cysteine synthase A
MLATVGGTPLVELRHVVPGECARVLVKLESHNPTGSMKDRMAQAVVNGAVSSGRLAPGSHTIEGVGPGFVPPMWQPGLADEILQVSTSEAKDMARRLAREEALFAGTSSGANVVAAIQLARRLGSGRTVVTLICDSGLKYLSTDLYS